MSIKDILRHLFFLRLIQKLILLNLFKSGRIDHEVTERRTTRLYLIMITTSLIALLIYTTFSPQTKSVRVQLTSLIQYEELEYQYSSTLHCPCKQISSEFSQLLSIEATYHQVCQSSFISTEWINYLFNDNMNTDYKISTDYRRWIGNQFQALQILCQISKEMVEDALNLFRQNQFVTTNLIPQKLFEIQIESSIQLFQQTIPNQFLRIFMLMRNVTSKNQLISELQTNYMVIVYGYDQVSYGGRSYPSQDGWFCSCISMDQCELGTSSRLSIDGFYMSCLIVESLLKSSLICLYNKSCIHDQIQANIISSQPSKYSFQSMNSSVTSQYPLNATVESMIHNLMIEEWRYFTNYSAYFEQCNSTQCTYSYTKVHDILYVVTTIIACLGGLIKVFTTISPVLVNYVPKTIQVFRDQIKKRSRNATRTVEIVTMPREISLRERVRLWLMKNVIQLNLFKSDNENDESREIKTTRLYLILLFVSLCVLLSYTLFIPQTTSVNIEMPSLTQFKELQLQYPSSVQCPCTQLAIRYKDFVPINPTYHQICESQFVSKQFLQHISNVMIKGEMDAVVILLSVFCDLSMQTINDARQLFYGTQFISAEALFQQLFQLQIDLIIEQFKIDTINQFWQTLQLIRLTTNVNALSIPPGAWDSDNFQTHVYHTGSIVTLRPTATIKRIENQSCSCVTDLECHHFIDYLGTGFIMPVGCYLLETFLLSNLACFFNSSCVKAVFTSMEDDNKPQALNLSVPSLFSTFNSLETILKHLMVEQWNNLSNYSNYFEQCNPVRCTYTYREQYNPLYMVTTLASLLGGLIMVLRFICPHLVKCSSAINKRIIKRFTTRQTIVPIRTPYVDNHQRPITFVERLRSVLVNSVVRLNLFKSEDRLNEQTELWITRLYLFLFSLVSLILIVYTFVNEQTLIVTVQKPTLEQYEYLLEQHDQLYCSYNRISVAYSEFTQINPNYHQICSSDFTSTRWIEYLFGDTNYSNPYLFAGVQIDSPDHQISYYDQLDFRTLSISQFYFLSHLCQLSEEIVQTAITDFLKQTFINSQAMSRTSFQTELRSIIEKFQSQIPLKMLRELKLITGLTQADALKSDYETNWFFRVNQTGTGFDLSTEVFPLPRHFADCNCGTTYNCTQLSTIRTKNGTILFTIPAFYVGCLSSQALIQSTMQCFYNRSCLDQIQRNINYNQLTLNVTLLNISKPSRYPPQTSIEVMLTNMFVEEWNSQINYDQHYKQSQPSHCQYQYGQRYSVSSVTKVTGLVGGINLGFRLITPLLVETFLYSKRKFFKTENMITPNEDIPPRHIDSIE